MVCPRCVTTVEQTLRKLNITYLEVKLGEAIVTIDILQKMERVKELIDYKEMNFSEIAYSLNYSSSSYLANQLKKVICFTISEYKKSKSERRNTIDNLL